ncbi:GNAT family N-acetyltransferase [Vibrio tubiashii]|uniref:GNAT family N-acetyltransferase n=1 Tax=Vibrio tubiashii TaxID=29498 RepID=UPI00349E58E9
MGKFRPFTQQDYPLLIEWIDSSELNYLWGGPRFEFPLTVEQISEHCLSSEVLPFVFEVNGVNAGYVELFRVSDSHFRICRVYICFGFRGQGVSKTMLTQLIELAQEKYNVSKLSLVVFEQNHAAKNSYASLGFYVTSEQSDVRLFEGKPWTLLGMEKLL